MRVVVNGERLQVVDDLTVAALLLELEVQGRVAVEVNDEIVPRSEHAHRRLIEDDCVEIVRAIGGG